MEENRSGLSGYGSGKVPVLKYAGNLRIVVLGFVGSGRGLKTKTKTSFDRNSVLVGEPLINLKFQQIGKQNDALGSRRKCFEFSEA